MNFIIFKFNDSTIYQSCAICSSMYRNLTYKITKNIDILTHNTCAICVLINKFNIFIKYSNNEIFLYKEFPSCIFYFTPSYHIYKLIL